MTFIPVDILMLICLGCLMAMFLSVLIVGFLVYERTTKKLMAKSLAEYQYNPDNGSKPALRKYMTDEELLAAHNAKQDALEKDLKKKLEELHRTEEAFEFNVQRGG